MSTSTKTEMNTALSHSLITIQPLVGHMIYDISNNSACPCISMDPLCQVKRGGASSYKNIK